jgi:hypothetical protein
MRVLYSLICLTIVFLNANSAEREELKNRKSIVFLDNIHKELKFFRIRLNTKESIIYNFDSNSIASINVISNRNNFEEIIILCLGIIGRYMNSEISDAIKNNSKIYIPSAIKISCSAPIGREIININTTVNSKIMIDFGNGTLSAKNFWLQIKNSPLSSKYFLINDNSPSVFLGDIDFENMISARIALENKNNAKLSGILSAASKSSWVPGLQPKLEKILVSYLKENQSDLMRRVMGKRINDEQMLRIGRQFLNHIQKPYDVIKQLHTIDSLKYIWKGNKYPTDLDIYYENYKKKFGM